MKEVVGNIWDFHKQGHWIVITTNGFVKKNGCAVMGRGVARDASVKFPELSKELGKGIKERGNRVFIHPWIHIITLPTKYNYWEKSDIELIEESLKELVKLIDDSGKIQPIYLVRPGCGNGGLTWSIVRPICEKYLDDRFTVVEKEK